MAGAANRPSVRARRILVSIRWVPGDYARRSTTIGAFACLGTAQRGADTVLPDRIALVVHVQAVRNVQIGSRFTLIEHRGGDIDEHQVILTRGHRFDAAVEIALRGELLPARVRRLGGDEEHRGRTVYLALAVHESVELCSRCFGRHACVEVVLARVEHDLSGAVTPDHGIEAVIDVGNRGSAKSAPDDRPAGKVAVDPEPEPDRGTANEQCRARGGGTNLVLDRKDMDFVTETRG